MEVLETSALEDMGRTAKVIQACADIGVYFALDDFGTGYSSLTYLKHLPVTLIKIDRSFVSGMLDDPDDLAILEGVLGLAHAFKREVIAEGMESAAQGQRLMALGCDLAQGYGIARPMPASQVLDWIGHWQTDQVWHERGGNEALAI
jgi:EAL domain-containing protein (putative c-di-GMP-specific phosphodiesterase class I)